MYRFCHRLYFLYKLARLARNGASARHPTIGPVLGLYSNCTMKEISIYYINAGDIHIIGINAPCAVWIEIVCPRRCTNRRPTKDVLRCSWAPQTSTLIHAKSCQNGNFGYCKTKNTHDSIQLTLYVLWGRSLKTCHSAPNLAQFRDSAHMQIDIVNLD